MIRAVIFDCFGVLYVPVGEDFYRTHIANFESHKQELYDLGQQANYGLISQQEFVAQVAALANMPEAEVGELLAGSHARNKAMVAFSQTLRPARKVGMLSNMSAKSIDAYFSPAERKQLFDDIVLSSEVGMVKPHPEIFVLAAQRLGVDTSECLFVDDSQANCEAATSVGMRAVRYANFAQATADITAQLNK